MPNDLPRLASDEIERYSRHITLPQVGLTGQRQLKAARVGLALRRCSILLLRELALLELSTSIRLMSPTFIASCFTAPRMSGS